jgi:hypothetical protein
MRWVARERWVTDFDPAEEVPDAQLVMATARLMRWL